MIPDYGIYATRKSSCYNQSNMKWTLLGKDLILEREKLLRTITEKRIINDREKEDWFVWLVS